MFTRLSFAQAIGQLVAVAIDCVVDLFTLRGRPRGLHANVPTQEISPKFDDTHGTPLVQSPDTPQEQHSVA